MLKSFAGCLALIVPMVLVAGGPAAAQGLVGENILITMPEGFKSGHDAAQDQQEIHELIPANETVEEWSSMVTLQIFHGIADIDPNLFAGQLAGNWTAACAGSAVRKLTDGYVNGFKFTLWTYTCPLNPQTGKPETMYLKGIAGSDAFYSVQYAFRDVPTDERETTALTYLVAASACDTRKADRPCPEGM